jgi:hypothetical protein
MAKAKRSTIQFKKRQLPAVLAARKKNKPMRLKAAAKVAKKKQAAGACSSLERSRRRLQVVCATDARLSVAAV